MSFTLCLKSTSGTVSASGSCSVNYNFDFSTVPPHPKGRAGKYKITTNLISTGLVTPATAADVGYFNANFSTQKYIYEAGTKNGASQSNFLGYVSPLAYSSSNIISQYVDVPIYINKPSDNVFTIDIRKVSDNTLMTRFDATVQYVLNIAFQAVIEEDGLIYERQHSLDFNL